MYAEQAIKERLEGQDPVAEPVSVSVELQAASCRINHPMRLAYNPHGY